MELFIDIVNMSISASFLVGAIVLFRLVFRKTPGWINVCLWALVAFRLICPFTFESGMSLIPNSEIIPAEILSVEPNRGIETASFEVVSNPRYSAVSEAIDNEVEITSIDGFQTDTVYLTIIWLGGMALMLFYCLISCLRIYLKIRQSIREKENIFICDEINTPFIFGLLRPKIYMPSSMSDEDKAFVIYHEKAHIKRRDHLWKPLGFLLLTVYWFNPVMWLSYILLCRDIELACDEKVIKEMGAEIKKSYSMALINCSAPKRMITACPVAFGEVGVKKRIKSVLSYKKPALWIVITAVISGIILAVCFATNPVEAGKEEYEWYYNPTYSAVGYGILSFVPGESYDSLEAECSNGTINIYDRFYNRLEEEKTGKIAGWSPDYLKEAPEETKITVKTEKDGKKTEYNIRIAKSENQNTEDGIGVYYSIIPLDCEIKEDGWGIYKLNKKGLSLAGAELDEAVSKAILSLNSEKKWMGECAAEGHIIFGTKKKGDITEVYLLEDYSCFGFKNGWFIEQSGHSIPCTMRFRISDKGYELIEAEYAKDGSEHVKSIKEMFPDIYVRRALNPSEKEKKSLWEQTLSYAEAYLKEIGREAKIGRYGDIEHILLTDVGVSVEVSNKLLGLKVDFDTGEIGFYERLEKGERYVYRTSYAEESNRIIYTKEKYGTGEVVEKLEVDSLTGNVIETSNAPEYISYFDAEVTDIKKNKSYALVKPFENTKERSLSDKFHISLDVTDLPELYEGLYVRIFYNGESKKEKDGTYTIDGVSAIYLYGDMNYIGKEAATASGKQPTTRAYAVTDTTQANAEEKQETAQKLYYSYASQTDMPTLTLSPGDRSFTFYLSVFSSYLPMGTYEETDDFIILETDDGEKNYVFLKEGKNLVFSAVKSSAVPEYKYGSDKKAVPCIPDMAVFRLTDIE